MIHVTTESGCITTLLSGDEPDDLTNEVVAAVEAAAAFMDDIAAEPEEARANLRARLLEVLNDPGVFGEDLEVLA